MSETAPTLGQRLKAERERRGMSTEKAANQMRLESWVVEALEAGDYVRIGPSVYAKGHLKKYAGLLGVSTAEPVAEVRPGEAAPAEALPASISRVRPIVPPPGAPLPWPQIAVAAAVIASIVGAIVWWRPWHERGAAAPASAVLPAPSASPVSVPNANLSSDEGTEAPAVAGHAMSDSDERAAPAPGAPAPGESAPGGPAAAASTPAASEHVVPVAAVVSTPVAPLAAPLPAAAAASLAAPPSDMPGAGRARLRLRFSADSWVDVHDAMGRQVFVGKGLANSVQSLSGMAPLKVYLGSADGVQLEINSRAVAIGPQFVSGNAARFEAGADGVLRRDSAAASANGVHARTAPPRD